MRASLRSGPGTIKRATSSASAARVSQSSLSGEHCVCLNAWFKSSRLCFLLIGLPAETARRQGAEHNEMPFEHSAPRGNRLERRALPKHAGKYSDRKTLVSVMLFPLIVLRLLWRNTHPVAPERLLPAWQQLISETAHWSLYALVLATTMTGWLLAHLCQCVFRYASR